MRFTDQSDSGPVHPTAEGSLAFPVLLTGVLAAFTAQQVLMPVLAPLAREVGLAELQLGLVISLAAAMLVVAAPIWGRACATLGHKRVLTAGLAFATAGVAGFAVVSQVALAGGLSVGWTFGLILATRGLLFGVGLSAVPVAAMAYVAATTVGTSARTAGISRLGAAQGLSVALGPAVGGLLAFAGLLGPLYTAPLVLASVGLLVAFALPAVPRQPAPSRSAGTAVRVFGTRVWPYLLAGFTLYLGLGLVLLTVGFLLQDRLALTAGETAQATGAILFTCGVVLVVTQGVLVPRLRWAPGRLLRVGTPIAATGLAGLAVAPGFWPVAAAMAAIALGLGIGLPGYTSGPTLDVEPAGQGAVAGLVTATNGLTFMIGPAAGAALYQVGQSVPFLTAAAATAAASLFVWLHPTFRADPGQCHERPPAPSCVAARDER